MQKASDSGPFRSAPERIRILTSVRRPIHARFRFRVNAATLNARCGGASGRRVRPFLGFSAGSGEPDLGKAYRALRPYPNRK